MSRLKHYEITGLLYNSDTGNTNILENENDRDFAFATMNKCIKELSDEHNVLAYITLHDVYLTQGDDIISVNQEINNVKPTETGTAIQKLIISINKSLEEKEIYTFVKKLKEQLNKESLLEIENMRDI